MPMPLPLPPPLHLFPQLPQLFGSDLVSTHFESHTEFPDAQLTPHWPFEQVGVPPGTAGHFALQALQLLMSERGSMQVMPQAMNGLWHWKPHFPALHFGAEWATGMHTTPQAPQFDVSLVVSTQDAPQVVSLPQAVVHFPPSQTWPAPQALPHTPQFLGSEASSTHWSVHFV
jgi:hypothetical protein